MRMLRILSIGLVCFCCQTGFLLAAITKGPYLQHLKGDMAVICFETDSMTAILQFGATENTISNVTLSAEEISFPVKVPGGKKEMKTRYWQHAKLDKLNPMTTYYYRVSSGDTLGEIKQFQTAPKEDAGTFRFVAFGDSRSNPMEVKRLSQAILAQSPAFVLHMGDFAEVGSNYELWEKEFFNPMDSLLSKTCLWPARGNHEGNGRLFQKFFVLPENRYWYSFDYGNAHIVCLDSEIKDQGPMCEWLENDLKNAKGLWKIAFYHRPTYNIGSYCSAWGRERVLPILHKYDVDVVFSGHTHVYERFFPLAPLGHKYIHPILFINTPGLETPLEAGRYHPYIAASSTEHHFSVIEVSDTQIEISVIGMSGKLIDQTVLKKTNRKFSESYLKNIRSEEMLDIYTDLYRLLRQEMRITYISSKEKPGEILLPILNQYVEGLHLVFEVEADPLAWDVAPLRQEVNLHKGEKRNIKFCFSPFGPARASAKLSLKVAYDCPLGKGQELVMPLTYKVPAANLSCLVQDCIGGHDLRLGAVSKVPGAIGEAVVFNGINSRGEALHKPSFRLGRSFAVELWLKTVQKLAENRFAAIFYKGSDKGYICLEMNEKGNLLFLSRDTDNSEIFSLTSEACVNDDQWHKIVIWRDWNIKMSGIMLDDKRWEKEDRRQGSFDNFSKPFQLSVAPWPGAVPFEGYIDEIVVHNEFTIQEGEHGIPALDKKSVILHWSFDKITELP